MKTKRMLRILLPALSLGLMILQSSCALLMKHQEVKGSQIETVYAALGVLPIYMSSVPKDLHEEEQNRESKPQ